LRRIRHSLVARLLAVCVLIAAVSIAATAWIAAASTSGSIEQQYNEDLVASASVYDEVLGYAATHSSWNGVQPTLDALARRTKRTITLTTPTGQTIDGTGRNPPAGTKPTAVVNPLAVSALPGTSAPVSGIDPRAVGPFKLPAADSERIGQAAKTATACMTKLGYDVTTRLNATGRTEFSPDILGSGRPAPAGPRPAALPPELAVAKCVASLGLGPTAAEKQNTGQFAILVNRCLSGRASGVGGDLADPVRALAEISALGPVEKTCAESAWRQMVAPHVAPPAFLFVSGAAVFAPRRGLSPTAQFRIALAGLAILLAAVVLCALAATRILRPIRALTMAARQVGRGDRSGRVSTRDGGQIGELAHAFNRMSGELDVAEDRRRRMVSDIAHELRTPLGNLRAWLEAAQDGVVQLDEKLAGSLLEESLLVQRVVEDLQELALADAGKLVFHPEPLDAAALATGVRAAHLAAADKAGLTLTVEDGGPVPLTADVARLRQALGNLVTNAIRYTPSGGSVTVRAAGDGDHVTLEVEDTGIGLRPEEIERVFERFWRAEQSRSRARGGSGLGLAITRHLIEAQGGQVSVRSEYGTGSVFTIRLPAGE
jgi:two-component system sensor histidine kinase BaeS